MISYIFYRYNFVYVASCIIVLLHAHTWVFFLQEQKCHKPKALVAFLDIGQGDAIYIQDSAHNTVLIDTGPKDSGVISRIQEVTGCKQIYIDTLLLTHPDADHIGEAKRLIDKSLVGTVLHNSFLDVDQPDETMMENELEKTVTSRSIVQTQDVVYLQDISIEILYPGTNPYRDHVSTTTTRGKKRKPVDDNLYSVVAKVVYTNTQGMQKSFLLTGDASVAIENRLVQQYGSYLESDVLKLGHHGSKTSSGQDFLAIVSPEEVVISAGKNNRYNHPSEDVVERVDIQKNKKPLRIRETFVEGNIVYKLE